MRRLRNKILMLCSTLILVIEAGRGGRNSIPFPSTCIHEAVTWIYPFLEINQHYLMVCDRR
jgi:hypothetical protein